MDVVVLGVSHETAQIELRERIAFRAEAIAPALASLVKLPGVPEGMIVSTCNRVEVYAAAHAAEAGLSAMRDWLCATHGVSPLELEGHLYARSGTPALKHIFRVVSSLDSLVVGEPQILGQVKDAYQVALGQRAAGGILNRVLHRAFSVAKRVRSETGIATHAVSVSYAAVELAKKIFGSLDGKTVLLIGAGEMGELAARHLQKNGAKEILVANRTWERAVDLAQQFSGTAVQFDRLGHWLVSADIVICAAAAGDGWLLGRSAIQDAVKARRHRPIFLIDIAVPRTIEPSANSLDDVYLYGIDDLRGVVDGNLAARKKEASKAEVIVEEEALSFATALAKIDLGPMIALLNGKLETIRKAEIERSTKALAALGPAERDVVEKMTRAIIAKIAHEPIAALKEGTVDPETLRRLYGLAFEIVPLPVDLDEPAKDGDEGKGVA